MLACDGANKASAVPTKRGLKAYAFSAFALVFAACAAALVAHVTIDIVGDYVLAHDTYDANEHASRADVLVLALGLAFAGIGRVLGSALHEARTGHAAPALTAAGIVGRDGRRFVFAVIVLSLPMLMAMELFDVVGAGGRVDDIADLLGGSAWLGLGVSIPVAALSGSLVRQAARMLLGSHRTLVAALGRLMALLARSRGGSTGRRTRADVVTWQPHRSIITRGPSKRGPPPLPVA